ANIDKIWGREYICGHMGYANIVESNGRILQFVTCSKRWEGKIRVIGVKALSFGEKGKLEIDGVDSHIKFDVSLGFRSMNYRAYAARPDEVRIERRKLNSGLEGSGITIGDDMQGELLSLVGSLELVALGFWPALTIGQELLNDKLGEGVVISES
ncbi:MAG: hypothetical protein AAB697_03930, partial [Patescibacteria group bacterium]